MPKIRTPSDTVRRILFAGNNSELIRKTGMSRGTFYNRKRNPEELRLTEFAALVRANGTTAEEMDKIVEVMT